MPILPAVCIHFFEREFMALLITQKQNENQFDLPSMCYSQFLPLPAVNRYCFSSACEKNNDLWHSIKFAMFYSVAMFTHFTKYCFYIFFQAKWDNSVWVCTCQGLIIVLCDRCHDKKTVSLTEPFSKRLIERLTWKSLALCSLAAITWPS